MGIIFSTILIAAPLAFLAGWLCSKALFRYLVNAQAEAAAAVNMANEVAPDTAQPDQQVAGDSESAEPQLQQQFNAHLKVLQARLQPLQAESKALKAALVERDQTITELRRSLKVQSTLPEESAATASATATARHRKLLEAMHDKLSAAEERNRQLELTQSAANTKALRIAQRYLRWRKKFLPRLKQYRQQRTIIGELREELRQRDLRQQEREAMPAGNADVAAVTRSLHRQDLQSLHGVGPALSKKMQDLGVYRLQQLAQMDRNELVAFYKSLGLGATAIARNNWQQQARQILGLPENSTPAPLPEELSA
jgi:predicted flap endonuclease-1-like 5' DNA nuclease